VHPNVRVIFLIGKKADMDKHSTYPNSSISDLQRLNTEMENYCDILQGEYL